MSKKGHSEEQSVIEEAVGRETGCEREATASRDK